MPVGLLLAWFPGHSNVTNSVLVIRVQAPLAYAGVSFANRRPYKILEDMSGVLQPVSAPEGH